MVANAGVGKLGLLVDSRLSVRRQNGNFTDLHLVSSRRRFGFSLQRQCQRRILLLPGRRAGDDSGRIWSNYRCL